jgi:hypothetical protein
LPTTGLIPDGAPDQRVALIAGNTGQFRTARLVGVEERQIHARHASVGIDPERDLL